MHRKCAWISVYCINQQFFPRSGTRTPRRPFVPRFKKLTTFNHTYGTWTANKNKKFHPLRSPLCNHRAKFRNKISTFPLNRFIQSPPLIEMALRFSLSLLLLLYSILHASIAHDDPVIQTMEEFSGYPSIEEPSVADSEEAPQDAQQNQV